MNLLYIAIVCGLIAVLYGILTSRQVLAHVRRQPAHDRSRRRDPGRRRAPIFAASTRRSPSSASSSRCIVVIFLGGLSAVGFVIGAILSGAAGLHRHEHLGPRQRPHRRSRAQQPAERPDHRLPRRRRHRHARRRPRAARDRRPVLVPDRRPAAMRPTTGRSSPRSPRSRSAPRWFRSSPVSAAASSPRPPTSAPTSSARSRPEFPRTIPATRR